ncbi:MAG: hypothetical protein NZM25_01470 [Leptospiraceae bacterium]|nr:hypothetical protein [Leptospiraceae bacterium]MDW8307614.1 hypothetical protein [Leptospiraceae bacterium]
MSLRKVTYACVLAILTIQAVSAQTAKGKETPPATKSAGGTASVREGKFGIDYSYAYDVSTLGAWFHVSEKLALAPRLGFSAGGGATNIQIGLLIPIYLATLQRLELFLAPHVGFSIQQEERRENIPLLGQITVKSESSSFDLSVYLGTQFPVTEQVHIYGMSGLGLNSRSIDPGGGVSKETETSFGTQRTALGLIFYFN